MKTAEKKYRNTSEAKEALSAQGYKHLFEVTDENVLQSDKGVRYPSDEFEIDEVHTVEGKKESELTSLYALTTKGGTRGVILDGFGMTGSVHRTNFLKHLKSKRTIRD